MSVCTSSLRRQHSITRFKHQSSFISENLKWLWKSRVTQWTILFQMCSLLNSSSNQRKKETQRSSLYENLADTVYLNTLLVGWKTSHFQYGKQRDKGKSIVLSHCWMLIWNIRFPISTTHPPAVLPIGCCRIIKKRTHFSWQDEKQKWIEKKWVIMKEHHHVINDPVVTIKTITMNGNNKYKQLHIVNNKLVHIH